MKHCEIPLCSPQTVQIAGQWLSLSPSYDKKGDSLLLRFTTGNLLILHSALDISEMIECPRVFIVEATESKVFMIFGGTMVYWVTLEGRIETSLQSFRSRGYEEYWTTQLLQYGTELIIIYEAGVLVLNDLLEVRSHTPKLFNDVFVALEAGTLKFKREDGSICLIPLEEKI